MLILTQGKDKLINAAGVAMFFANTEGYLIAIGLDGTRLATCGKYGSLDEAEAVLRRICEEAEREEEITYGLPPEGVIRI